MSYQKLIDFWGFDNFSHAKPEALKSINISEELKRFLVEIGLPRELDLFYLRGCLKSIVFSLNLG